MQNVAPRVLFVIVVAVIVLFVYKTKKTQTMKSGSAVVVENDRDIVVSEEEKVKAIIKKYLIESPEVIIQSIEGLQKRKTQELEDKVSEYIKSNKSDIENTTGSPVLGNAKGDIIIVSFYDYNCSYCKKGEAFISQLLQSDSNVKVILRPLPVLGDASNYLGKIVLAVNTLDSSKFRAVHEGILNLNSITKESVEKVLADTGLNVVNVEEIADSKEINDLINKNIEVAKKLKIHGVPAYVINGRLIPGLMDLGQMQNMIQDIRNNKKP